MEMSTACSLFLGFGPFPSPSRTVKSKNVGGDQHPLSSIPTKSSVEPPEFGAQITDFTVANLPLYLT